MVMLLLLLVSINMLRGEFYAYHTKVQHSATDYVSDYADIIVKVNGGTLEFTRQTFYQPRWRSETGSFLVDDLFPGRDIDGSLDYTYVRLIDNSPERIMVHWRYFPDIDPLIRANAAKDPMTPYGFEGVVHEFFTIYPDGKVERLVRNATNSSYEGWLEGEGRMFQVLQLSARGIEHHRVQRGMPEVADEEEDEDEDEWDEDEEEVEEISAWPADFPEPRLYFPLNEAEEGLAFWFDGDEEMESPLLGSDHFIMDGVNAEALTLDGYYDGVMIEDGIGDIHGGFSISVWLALDVYPYNDAPILHQSKAFGKQGLYFGIDPYGHPIFRMNGKEVVSPKALSYLKWQQLNVTVAKGRITLYQNGEQVASGRYRGKISLPEIPTLIGLNSEKARCSDFVRSNQQNLPFIFGLQGAMDELMVHHEVLDAASIGRLYQFQKPEDLNSPIQKGVLPGELGIAENFGAYYKTLPFQPLWDSMWRLSEYADVVVKFDHIPTSVVYWHGSNYAANWVTDANQWMSDQSSEIWGPHGCSEHMADKQVRHSYVRIIENTPARVVVHWRYPCVDVGYICTDQANWSDEIHTIYPDGTGIRKVHWNNATESPGFQDIQFFTNPGENALDVVGLQAMTVANVKGEIEELLWAKPDKVPEITIEDAHIELLNSKSKQKIFVVFQGGKITPWGHVEQSAYTDDPFAGPWNHWPMHFVPSDGRFAVAHDRVTHFALGANDWAPEFGSLVMYGFTDEGIESALPAARAWKNPPLIENVKGAKTKGFDKDQKAFVFSNADRDISFSITGSEMSPIVNPCFVFKNWGEKDASISVNGKHITEGTDLKLGRHWTDSGRDLIIWLRTESTKQMEISIKSE